MSVPDAWIVLAYEVRMFTATYDIVLKPGALKGHDKVGSEQEFVEPVEMRAILRIELCGLNSEVADRQ